MSKSDADYFEQAQFLIVNGYVPIDTNPSELSIKLQQAEAKIESGELARKDDVMTRESVYGEEADIIAKISQSKSTHEKKLIEPGEMESAALRAKWNKDNGNG